MEIAFLGGMFSQKLQLLAVHFQFGKDMPKTVALRFCDWQKLPNERSRLQNSVMRACR